MTPTLEERRESWAAPPVDDVGYIASAELLREDDYTLKSIITRAEQNRYFGWRNENNAWRRVLRMDETRDKVVMDFGCGIGIEALQYARNRNEVWLVDLPEDNWILATQVLELFGYSCSGGWIVGEEPSQSWEALDVIHSAGVLHHIPNAEAAVAYLHQWLKPDGELRLMVYSDRAWQMATGMDPPNFVEDHPASETYWRFWDSVGGYADWYNAERLEQRFGAWFTLEDYQPIALDGAYVGAILRKR